MKEPSRENLIAILKHFGVHWQQVTRNALNVACPFCDDSGTHCGLFYDKQEYMFSCWKCKAGGQLFTFLQAAIGIGFQEYQDVLNSQYTETHVESVKDEIIKLLGRTKEEVAPARTVQWPPAGSIDLAKFRRDPLVQQFLSKRRLDADFCISKGCRVGITERYANRFLIPVYQKGKVVAFQGRDMTNRHPAKYLTEGDVSEYLYGFDDVDENSPIGIAEGIFSSWSIDNAVSSFSAALGDKQLLLMQKKKPPYWVLCWDMGSDGSDKFWEGTRVAQRLAEFFGRDKVKYVTLPPGEDPDSLGIIRMRELLLNPRSLWKSL